MRLSEKLSQTPLVAQANMNDFLSCKESCFLSGASTNYGEAQNHEGDHSTKWHRRENETKNIVALQMHKPLTVTSRPMI